MKKNKIGKVLAIAGAFPGLAAVSSCGYHYKHDFKILKKYLIEMPTYKTIDYDYAQTWFKENPIGAGGCSAVVKDVDPSAGSHLIIGRNMDYGYSNKCAYIVRTDEEGKHRTLGFAYATNKTSPSYNHIKKYGIGKEWRRIMPFFCTDIINDQGLYCEIDMRNIEWDASTGKSIFRCEGTKPSTGINVHMVALTRFIVSNCATVQEAVDYVKNDINVFNNEKDWNFSFILADATGKYGLLEFGHDDIYWQDWQACQTNYFVNDVIVDQSENKFGIGRRYYLLNHLNEVTDTTTMYNLINQLSYSNVYKGRACPFDMRSETSDFITDVPYEWLMPWHTDEDDVNTVYDKIDAKLKELEDLPEKERRKLSWYWQSTFTEVVDIPNQSIHIRMFENDDYIFDFTV